VICPWHGYEYDPHTGQPPPGFPDCATGFAVDLREDGLYVELPVAEQRISLMDQVVDVLCEWGIAI
jgi:pyruvate oxidase